ncbi:hypothetical protein RIF29_12391 [Crotalaria pallida]|uniref:Uncharacterized protein n=1 Tax=Crotalaria pallida TaxID=3830 RepID=A0AAN9IN38_CROPI
MILESIFLLVQKESKTVENSASIAKVLCTKTILWIQTHHHRDLCRNSTMVCCSSCVLNFIHLLLPNNDEIKTRRRISHHCIAGFRLQRQISTTNNNGGQTKKEKPTNL